MSQKSWERGKKTVKRSYQRFKESGEISVCKRQGQKWILDICYLRTLRWHCTKTGDGNPCMGSGISVCDHGSPCHPHIQVKALSRRSRMWKWCRHPTITSGPKRTSNELRQFWNATAKNDANSSLQCILHTGHRKQCALIEYFLFLQKPTFIHMCKSLYREGGIFI